jgi:hypothetical protein
MPGPDGTTSMVTPAFVPERISPSRHVSVASTGAAQVPFVGEALANEAPSGNETDTRTPVAAAGPRFLVVTV